MRDCVVPELRMSQGDGNFSLAPFVVGGASGLRQRRLVGGLRRGGSGGSRGAHRPVHTTPNRQAHAGLRGHCSSDPY